MPRVGARLHFVSEYSAPGASLVGADPCGGDLKFLDPFHRGARFTQVTPNLQQRRGAVDHDFLAFAQTPKNVRIVVAATLYAWNIVEHEQRKIAPVALLDIQRELCDGGVV